MNLCLFCIKISGWSMYSYNMTCYRICVVWWWCFQRSLVREVPTRSPGQEVLAVTVAATALIARKNVSSCIHERFFAKHLANPIPNVAWSTSSPWVNSVGFPLPNGTYHPPDKMCNGHYIFHIFLVFDYPMCGTWYWGPTKSIPWLLIPWGLFYWQISLTSILIRAWTSNYIQVKQWDIISHALPNFSGGLVKLALKLDTDE